MRLQRPEPLIPSQPLRSSSLRRCDPVWTRPQTIRHSDDSRSSIGRRDHQGNESPPINTKELPGTNEEDKSFCGGPELKGLQRKSSSSAELALVALDTSCCFYLSTQTLL